MPVDEYIAFVDESGDSVLDPVDPQFPVMILAICLFNHREYEELVIPSMRNLKLTYFGRGDVLFHEREIRQRRGMFTSLGSETRRTEFLEDLTRALTDLPFIVVAAAADKRLLKGLPTPAVDLYQQCLRAGLSSVYQCLDEMGALRLPLNVIVESRGRKEDKRLKELFDEFQRPAPTNPESAPAFELSFAGKTAGLVGLEIADLVAYPVARHILARPQAHDPFGLIRRKMYRGPDGEIEGYGLTMIGR